MEVPLADGRLLDWHDHRRRQELPTISTLIGPDSLGLREWRGWSSSQHRPAAAGANLNSAAAVWFEAVKKRVDPIGAAISWMAIRADSDGRPDPVRMTQFDLDRRGVPNANAGPVHSIAYRILLAAIREQPFDCAGNLRQLGSIPFLAGLCGLIAESQWPTILLVEIDSIERFASAMGDLERLATLLPRLPIGICIRGAIYETAVASPTRTMALAREGEIRLVGVSAEVLTDRLRAAGVPEPLPVAAIRHLASTGLAPEVAGAYVDAAAEVRQPAIPQDSEDLHRSASERFLFEQLESMVQTAGLFRPNRELEFLHGSRLAEADLVAPDLKLVIEVDGGYYHLNPEQYRRDRRKDHAYQRHGYWVLRFLAEDIVVDLEAILSTVLDAVASRRPTAVPEVAAFA